MKKLNFILLFSTVIYGCSFFKEKPTVDPLDGKAGFVKEVRAIANSVATEVELSESTSFAPPEAQSTVMELAEVRETVMTNNNDHQNVMVGKSRPNQSAAHSTRQAQVPGPATKSQGLFANLKRLRQPTADGTYKLDSSAEPTGTRTAGQYRVNSGDTLMKIAFEHYGDITKWRSIYDLNKDSIQQFNQIQPGMVLKLGQDEFVVVERNGKPYLIKTNDTLIKISNLLYGNISEWKSLWQNNRQLIRDPNKIYAGFKLYYLPK